MFKKLIALILISIAVVFFMPESKKILSLLLEAHDAIAKLLMEVFSGGQAGNIVRELIALLALPLVIGIFPALIYWLLKRHAFPYFMDVVWIIWLLQTGALVMLK